MRRVTVLVLVLGLAVVASVFWSIAVTVAVTSALAQTAGGWQIVATNLEEGGRMATKQAWPDQAQCEAALGNWPEVFAGIAAVAQGMKVDIPKPVSPDAVLTANLEAFVVNFWAATHKLPQYKLACELLADPA